MSQVSVMTMCFHIGELTLHSNFKKNNDRPMTHYLATCGDVLSHN